MDTARLKEVAAPVPRATHTHGMNKTEAVEISMVDNES